MQKKAKSEPKVCISGTLDSMQLRVAKVPEAKPLAMAPIIFRFCGRSATNSGPPCDELQSDALRRVTSKCVHQRSETYSGLCCLSCCWRLAWCRHRRRAALSRHPATRAYRAAAKRVARSAAGAVEQHAEASRRFQRADRGDGSGAWRHSIEGSSRPGGLGRRRSAPLPASAQDAPAQTNPTPTAPPRRSPLRRTA